jgi:hypothetical protein
LGRRVKGIWVMGYDESRREELTHGVDGSWSYLSSELM